MSNFFTRSKDDMKYLFKNKEELSKKERKRKRRGWGTLIGLILVLIQLIVSVFLVHSSIICWQVSCGLWEIARLRSGSCCSLRS